MFMAQMISTKLIAEWKMENGDSIYIIDEDIKDHLKIMINTDVIRIPIVPQFYLPRPNFI